MEVTALVHFDESALLKYVSGRMADDAVLAVDEHLACCEKCACRVRSLRYLVGRFDSVWSGWTAAAHGEAGRRLRLTETLLGVREQSAPDVRPRLERLLSARGPAIEVLVDCTRRLALAMTSVLSSTFEAVLQPAMTGVASAEAVEIHATLLEAADLLAYGKSREAALHADRCAQESQWAAEIAQLDLFYKNRHAARVDVDARKGRALVYCWPDADWHPEVAVLIAAERTVPPKLDYFSPVAGADYLLAEFRNLQDCHYTLVLGPEPGHGAPTDSGDKEGSGGGGNVSATPSL